MNWEEKRRMHMLKDLLDGKTVDLSKDEELYFAAFGKQVSMDKFVQRDKFVADAERAKQIKSLNGASNGYVANKKLRHIGEVPANIFLTRPEFHPDNPDREKNIINFLNTYTQFRTVDHI